MSLRGYKIINYCRAILSNFSRMEPMEDINDAGPDYRFFDILSDELALNIFKFLDLHSLFVCLGVNTNFRRLISDPSVGMVRS